MKPLIPLIFIFFCFCLYSQNEGFSGKDTLVLIDGNLITNIGFVEIRGDTIIYNKFKKKKVKQKIILIYDVFAILDEYGQETVIYEQNDSLGLEFAVEEMRFYLDGLSNGWDTYNNYFIFPPGFLLSGASVLYFNPTTSIIVPILYPTAVFLFNSKIDNTPNIPEIYRDNKHYKLGYRDAARGKKIRSAVYGSIAGYAGFMIGKVIFHFFNKE